MRKRFEQQLSLGVIPISEVVINTKSRHQLPPLLKALQHMFVTPELNKAVFDLLESRLMSGKQKTGRLGMSLWEILVLGLVRLNLDVDYDFLHDQANEHETLRGILGVGRSDFTRGHQYKYQTLIDNVQLLDEDLIRALNELVVKASHGLIKKKEGVKDLGLCTKVDSYVVESNIHFPTDLSLLWDSGRKCLDTVGHLLNVGVALNGWSKHAYWRRILKNLYRRSAEIHRKKGGNYKSRLKSATRQYTNRMRVLREKCKISLQTGFSMIQSGDLDIRQVHYIKELQYYLGKLNKHLDLVERRILNGEQIPHSDKEFSIFEPHVEWLSKGKLHKKVELGHAVSIITDRHHFILDFEIMQGMGDAQAGRLIGERIIKSYRSGYRLESISFDRGYYSSLLKQYLSEHFEEVIMPKRGRKTSAQEEEENQEDYKKLRRAHSAVESNINQLEHHGLNRCADKGIKGFRRYVALGVLSYNLHRMGKLLIALESQAEASAKVMRRAA